jgi:hypothetical protein
MQPASERASDRRERGDSNAIEAKRRVGQFTPPASSSRSSIRRYLATFGVVAAHLIDEALGVLAPDERLDGVT